ncbi:hypothetical protein [Stenotrophomonas phage BUCTxx99]|nr:hypothetical protein [Stenotrophomonas phage BUCTxx99]
MKKVAAITLAIAGILGTAHAQTVTPEQVAVRESEQGESYEAFVLRTARFMNGWTKDSNAELCGVLTQKDGRFYVVLGTIRSQLSCKSAWIVDGTQPTGDTLHSHPATDVRGRIKITDQTRAAEGRGVPQTADMEVNTRVFSKGDYVDGPGFLVADNRVQHQSGKGTVRTIGQLPPAGQ